jgi:RNA polymerase sigma factor (sigma-70 family)
MITPSPPLPKEEQERLLALWKAGDRRAKDKLFRSMVGFVVSIARRYRGVVGNRFEDLLQVGFMAMSYAIDGWDPARGTLATYARGPIGWAMGHFLLADSVVIQPRGESYANRKIIRAHVSLDEPLVDDDGSDTRLDLLMGTAPRPDDLLEMRERFDALRMAVAELPHRERTVMERRWLTDDDVTLREIGQTRGCSHEAIRQIETIALRKIEQSIDKVGT